MAFSSAKRPRIGSFINVYAHAALYQISATSGAICIAFATIVKIKQLREVNDYCDYTEKGKEGAKPEAEPDPEKEADFKDYI